MIVYVLTCGEYSDYSIMKVTTSLKVAEAYEKLHGWHIETFDAVEEDDESIKEADELLLGWSLRINESGAIRHKEKIYFESKREAEVDDLGFGEVRVNVCNEDLDKATKIAMDARAKFFAEKYNL